MPTIKIVPMPGLPVPGPQGPQGPRGEPGYSEELTYVVTGGASISQPIFNGSPLFSGWYITAGSLIFFEIQVEMTNIVSFGTGQYYVDLPIEAKHDTIFRAGHLHDTSTGYKYAISGHVDAGSKRMYLSFAGSNGIDLEFDYNSPITLSQQDSFHIAGSYLAVS